MITFSRQIFICLNDQSNISIEIMQQNLNQLSEKLLWAVNYLKYDENVSKNVFNLEFNDSTLALPFVKQELNNSWNFEELTNGKLKYFFKFLDYIESLQRLSLINIDISQQLLKSFYINIEDSDANSYDRQLKGQLIVRQIRQNLKEIYFQSVNFFGSYSSSFPMIYPNIERLEFFDVWFNNNAKFGIYT
ncbi:hypothetical protein FGO68_gene12134 [Halteria grandinella]|uniref:Uncharacterized protein n=1 Tax=Halteria grandinella TaxID=5974 RepID=A0A8J8T8R3_HALGN|nr:hypothetical protein FGO68_gene12134 [Halteria grandinella]